MNGIYKAAFVLSLVLSAAVLFAATDVNTDAQKETAVQPEKETVVSTEKTSVQSANSDSLKKAEESGAKKTVKATKEQMKKVVPYSGWLTDMEKAKKKAQKESKDILVVMAGNRSWDGNSETLEDEIFCYEPVVKKLESEHVLVKISFPKNSKDLTPELRRAFSMFRKEYAPQVTTPAVILIYDRYGTMVGRFETNSNMIRRIKIQGFLKNVSQASKPVYGKR